MPKLWGVGGRENQNQLAHPLRWASSGRGKLHHTQLPGRAPAPIQSGVGARRIGGNLGG